MASLFQTVEAMFTQMPGARRSDLFMPAQSDTLVYLIHGVTGTPLEMKYVARRLAREGWDIYLPTLPGHCLGFREMVRSDEDDWSRHVQGQLAFARKHYRRLFAVGLSAGALLALEGSIAVPLEGIGVLSPTFFYDGWNAPWTLKLLPFGLKLPRPLQYLFFHWDGPPYGIKDPALQRRIHEAYSLLARWKARIRRKQNGAASEPERSRSAEAVGYPIFSLKTLSDSDRLYKRVRAALPRVTAPALIIQAREDDFTGPKNSKLVYDEIGSVDKKWVLLDDCYHVITVDKQRNTVAEELIKFIGPRGPIPDRPRGGEARAVPRRAP